MPLTHPLSLIRNALASALLLWAACAADAAGASPLTLAVSKTPLSLPIYVAEAQGLFVAEGLNVRTVECMGGHRCMALVLQGSADVATVSDVPIMFHAFERSDFVVLATIVTSASDLKLIARTSSAILTPSRLEGRRIGIVPKTSSQYFLDAYLLLNGLDPAKVERVPLQPETMGEALRACKVDAVAVWEPFGYQIMNQMPSEANILFHAGGYSETFNLVASLRTKSAGDAPLAALMRALQKAERFIKSDPEQAKRILATRLAVTTQFVSWVWPSFQYQLSLDVGLIRTLESEARWALREKLIDARPLPEFRSFIHEAPLRSVYPAAVGIDR